MELNDISEKSVTSTEELKEVFNEYFTNIDPNISLLRRTSMTAIVTLETQLLPNENPLVNFLLRR